MRLTKYKSIKKQLNQTLTKNTVSYLINGY